MADFTGLQAQIPDFGLPRDGKTAPATGLARSPRPCWRLQADVEGQADPIVSQPLDPAVIEKMKMRPDGTANVTPAQQLTAVVPADSRLEAEAMGFRTVTSALWCLAQATEIKVDTFNFTKYALLHGEVMTASQDAIPREKPGDGAKPRAALSVTSEPQGQEPA